MDQWLWCEGLYVRGLCEVLHFWESSLTLIHKETSLHARESTQLGAEVRAVLGGWLGLSKEQICGFTESCAARPALNAWCTRLCIPAASLGVFSFAGWTGGTGWSLLGKALLLNAVPETCTSVVCAVPFPSSPAALLRASVGTRETVVWHSFASPGRSYKVRHKSITNISQIIIFLSEYQTRQASDKMGAACFRRLRGFAKCFQASQLLFSWQLLWSFLCLFCGKWKITAHGCVWRKKIFLSKTFFFALF